MGRLRRILFWGAIALGAVAAGPATGPAFGSSVRAPVLGDWEGMGAHGLPLSFSLARVHRRITISDVVVGYPSLCPGRFAPTVAVGYPRPSYFGPGAPPVVRLGWRPDEIGIQLLAPSPAAPIPLQLDGRLLGSRQATLSMPAPSNEPRGCGWPSRRLTWHVVPAKRTRVARGAWTGTVSVPGGSGTLLVRVAPSGRIIDLFKVVIRCATGGGGSFQAGPPAEEFISAAGAFQGTGDAEWSGRFAPRAILTGTIKSSDFCGSSSSGIVHGTFRAHPG